jgi:hypothetical protein
VESDVATDHVHICWVLYDTFTSFETLRLCLTDLTHVQSLTSVNYAWKCNIGSFTVLTDFAMYSKILQGKWARLIFPITSGYFLYSCSLDKSVMMDLFHPPLFTPVYQNC